MDGIYDSEHGYDYDVGDEKVINESKVTHYTFLFNTYVMMQVFNEINCRKIQPDEINVFKGFFNNPFFLFIIFISVAVQILLVEIGGSIVEVLPLSIG